MRVLYFSDNASGHNRRFLEKLAESSHEIWFLDVSATQTQAGWLPPLVRKIAVRNPIARDAEPARFLEFVSEFREIIGSVRPTLVHAGPVQTCGYVAAESGFHPLLVMSWGSDLLVDAHRSAEWERASAVALLGADGFFCDCDAVRAAARKYVSFRDENIVQFPWGIKPGSFGPLDPRSQAFKMAEISSTISFLCTRSWEGIYDIATLLKAFEIAYKVNRRIRLILLGDGSQRQAIRRYIVENSLSKVISTPGVIAAEELPEWFRAASAYISCSRSDGTSISLLEAMSTGLPVIVTDIPSNREWVRDGDNGWLAPMGSPKDFADRILRVTDLVPEARELISNTNRRIVAERADWDRNFPKLFEVYDRLINAANAR